jgi:hypothetical protein
MVWITPDNIPSIKPKSKFNLKLTGSHADQTSPPSPTHAAQLRHQSHRPVSLTTPSLGLSSFLSPPCRICVSLRLSLFFLVALTGDGRDCVAAAQSEMGNTNGTKRRRSVMKAESLSVSLYTMPDLCLSPSLSLLGRMFRKLFESKKFLKLHVRYPDAVTPPSYAAHPTDQTTTPSPSPTNVDQTTPPLPSPTHGDQITLSPPSLTHDENSTLPRPRHASHYPDSMGRSLGGGFESSRWAAEIESSRWAVEIEFGVVRLF